MVTIVGCTFTLQHRQNIQAKFKELAQGCALFFECI